MVQLNIEHTFDGITPDEFWTMMLNPEFDAGLEPALGVKLRKELERKEDADKVWRRVRVVPGFPIPGPLKKVFGEVALEYMEESTFHKARKVMEWVTTPNLFPAKVVAKGNVEAMAVAGGRLRRVIAGQITVNMLGVGGLIERAVLESVKGSYEKAASFTRQWVAQGKHKQK